MTPPLNLRRITILSGLAGMFWLWIVPMIIMIGVSGITSALLGENGSRTFLEKAFPFFFFIIVLGGGAMFGWSLSRLNHYANKRLMMITGGLGFGLPFLATVFTLNMAEAIVVAGNINMPLHILFAILFNSGMLFTSALHGLSYGIALKSPSAMWQLALASGLAGVLGFGAVNLVMDSIGMRVGAPGAAERATMIVTLVLGNLVGAFTGATVLGFLFSKLVNKTVIVSEAKNL